MGDILVDGAVGGRRAAKPPASFADVSIMTGSMCSFGKKWLHFSTVHDDTMQ